MGRLIDADDLIEVIEKSRPLNWTDSESELQENADYNHFIEMVNSQPTAYDIEKVVAELEREKESNPCRNTQCKDCKYTKQCYEGEMCYKVGFDNAIEIVRVGSN